MKVFFIKNYYNSAVKLRLSHFKVHIIFIILDLEKYDLSPVAVDTESVRNNCNRILSEINS